MSKKKNSSPKPEGFPRLASATADPDLVPLSEMDKEKKAAAKNGKGKGKKAKGEAKAKAKAPAKAKAKAPKENKPKKLSCRDAAAQVLKAKGEPMQAKAMIEAMAEKKLWSSDAATPHATLYAAIIREIAAKGKDARFKKTDRGHFAFNG
jgi:hypothetical protein